jgi:hypothetical protein
MPSEFPMNDPQNIWQNQPTEAFKMSADQLRHKAEKRRRRAHFLVLSSIVIGVIMFVFLARQLATVPESFSPVVLGPLSLWSSRIGFGVLCLCCIYVPYRGYKRLWPGRLSPDATLNTTVQSYRSELEKWRNSGRNTKGVLVFFFLGMAMVTVPMLMVKVPTHIKATPMTGPGLLLNVAPFLLLAMGWVIMLRMMNRSRLKLRQEIEQLRVFERENRL